MATHEPWQIDKRIPVALVLALLTQAAAAVIWAARVDARIAVVESHVEATKDDPTRITRLESAGSEVSRRLGRIEDKLDRVLEHGGTR